MDISQSATFSCQNTYIIIFWVKLFKIGKHFDTLLADGVCRMESTFFKAAPLATAGRTVSSIKDAQTTVSISVFWLNFHSDIFWNHHAFVKRGAVIYKITVEYLKWTARKTKMSQTTQLYLCLLKSQTLWSDIAVDRVLANQATGFYPWHPILSPKYSQEWLLSNPWILPGVVPKQQEGKSYPVFKVQPTDSTTTRNPSLALGVKLWQHFRPYSSFWVTSLWVEVPSNSRAEGKLSTAARAEGGISLRLNFHGKNVSYLVPVAKIKNDRWGCYLLKGRQDNANTDD